MGCDIHPYLDWDEAQKDDGTWYVNNIAKLHISRNYLLFAILADVRNYGKDPIKPVSEPKGLPDRVSYIVQSDYTLFVLPEGEEDCGEEGCCSYEDGQRWGERYGWWDKEHGIVNHPDWHSASWFNVEELKKVQEIYASTPKEYPDLKFIKPGQPIPKGFKVSETYAWSNTPETTVVEEIEPGLMGKHEVLESIIKMMESLNDGDVNRSRMVFWFDN